jgi:hypothetical protein
MGVSILLCGLESTHPLKVKMSPTYHGFEWSYGPRPIEANNVVARYQIFKIRCEPLEVITTSLQGV